MNRIDSELLESSANIRTLWRSAGHTQGYALRATSLSLGSNRPCRRIESRLGCLHEEDWRAVTGGEIGAR